jgi:exosortase A
MSAILTQPTPAASAWRQPAIVLGLLMLAVLLLYRDTAIAMVGIWSRSDTFAHAFLVPPISMWLAWRGRERLLRVQPRPAWFWLLPLALAATAWMLGDLVSVNALTQFALVAMLVLLVPLVTGWQATRVLLFPLLFLFFSVPVGEFLLPTLMEGTADFTVAALRLSGIPVYREGLNFIIPSGSWSVVEACSGVRYLIASLMVGSLFAYLNYQSLTRRLVFVGVSIVVPIVANWLRAYMIVMIGHLSDNRLATGVDHLVYGWVFFGVVILIMFMIGARWSEPDAPAAQGPRVTVAGDGSGGWKAWMVPGLAAAAVMALPHAGLQVARQQVTDAQVQLTWSLPGQGGWTLVQGQPHDPARSPTAAQQAWQPRFEGASQRVDAAYQRQGQTVGVHVAYYRNQGPGRKLVSSQNVIVPSQDPVWSQIGVSAHRVVDDPAQPVWRAVRLLRGGAAALGANRLERTVWLAYWVDDRFTANDIVAKALGAAGLLKGGGDDGAAVILYTDAAPAAGGNDVLADFARANLGAIRQALRDTQARR